MISLVTRPRDGPAVVSGKFPHVMWDSGFSGSWGVVWSLAGVLWDCLLWVLWAGPGIGISERWARWLTSLGEQW